MAEFFPDAEERRRLHYGFVFGYLRDAVSRTGFFCERDWEWERKIQARFMTFEQMARVGMQGMLEDLLNPDRVFRRVRDLQSSAVEVAGRPGVLIRMPPPESTPCAYFVVALLDTPAAEFRATVQSLLQSVDPMKEAETVAEALPPTDRLGPYHPRGKVLFTLERTSSSSGHATGVVCCVHPNGVRNNLGIVLPPDADRFVSTLQALLEEKGFPNPERPLDGTAASSRFRT